MTWKAGLVYAITLAFAIYVIISMHHVQFRTYAAKNQNIFQVVHKQFSTNNFQSVCFVESQAGSMIDLLSIAIQRCKVRI